MTIITAEQAAAEINTTSSAQLRAAYRALAVGQVISLPRREWKDKSHPAIIVRGLYRKSQTTGGARVRSNINNFYITKLKDI